MNYIKTFLVKYISNKKVFVLVHLISPTSLRSRSQTKFKYFYLSSPFETSFKDKIVTKLKCSKADNTLGMRWLFLTMTAVGIGTMLIVKVSSKIMMRVNKSCKQIENQQSINLSNHKYKIFIRDSKK